MPAPVRGAGVLEQATVTAVGTETTISLAGDTFTLPHVTPPTVGATVWVLFTGRLGLVLGEVT